MNKSLRKLQFENNKMNNYINIGKSNGYFASFIMKIISFLVLFLVFFFQLEFLLFFIIKAIGNNIYLAISLFIIFHIILIKFIVQSVLYVLQCPLIQSICFYSFSCNQFRHLFEVSKKFVSLYKNLLKKNRIIEKKDLSLINDISNIMNGYLFFFKTIKKDGELSESQKNVYNKLNVWMNNFESYKKHKDTLSKNKEENKNEKQNLISFIRILAIDANEIIKILNEFFCDNYEVLSFKTFYNCFIKNDFWSKEQLSKIFHYRFNNTNYFFLTSDNQLIEYTIISYEKLNEIFKSKNTFFSTDNKEKEDQEVNSKNLLIYCNPNGMIYQLFTPDKFLYILEGGCDILLWNYRGYGSSTGYPTFQNAKSDVLELYDFAKKNFGYKKYGVYGYSIGGCSATFLANKRKLDVLICDRNFTNISEIAKNIPYIGRILYYLANFLNFKYDYNINDFINTKNKHICKIVLCDPNDDIIPNCSSLKSGISKYIIKKYCFENKLKEKENILDIFLDSKGDLKSKFIEALLYISSLLLKFKENPFTDIITKKSGIINKKEKGHLQDILLLNIKDNNDTNKKYFKNILIKTIINIFKNFSFSAENLDSFKKFDEKRLKFLNIDNYFNNFFVWGSISDEKINEFNGFTNPFTVENNIIYINKAINDINEFCEDKVVKAFENEEDYLMIFKYLNIIKSCLNIFKNKNEFYESVKGINKGRLIRLNCGHNGNIGDLDEDNLVDILMDVKFFI